MSEILGVFGINWKLLIVQAVNFGALLIILTYFLYKPVLAMLDKRRALIEKGVQDAAAAKQSLADASKKGDMLVAQASSDATEIVAHAKDRAEEKGTYILSEAEARAAAIVDDAVTRATETTLRAQKESEAAVAQAAILAAEKVLNERL